MKKTLIAASLAAIFSGSAVADTTLYGNFRASLNTGDLNATAGSDASVVNNASRLGVKGSAGTDSLKGIYHLQMGANNDTGGAALSSRFYFAGLKGGFGKVIVGRLSTPYKMAGVKQDPFYDTSAGPANGGSNYGYSTLNNGFTDNAIGYYSPKVGGGISFNATVAIDDGANDDHDYGFGVEWSNKTSKVGIGYLAVDSNDANGTAVVAGSAGADSATRVYGSTKIGSATIGASYEDLDLGAGASAEFTHINGAMKVGAKTKLAASFGSVSGNGAGSRNAAGDGFNVGVFHNVLKATTISAIYTSVDYDAAGTADRDGLAIGLIQKF